MNKDKGLEDHRETLVEDMGLALRRFFTTNFLLRCPACARGKIAKGFFGLQTRCDHCGARFERYAGNFLVSMSLTYFITVVILAVLGLVLILNYGFFDSLTWVLIGVACLTVVLLYRPMQVLTLWLLWVFGQVYPD